MSSSTNSYGTTGGTTTISASPGDIWTIQSNDTSGTTVNSNSLFSSSNATGLSRSNSRCGHATQDGSSCTLDPVYDDGKCHWHTETQCYRQTKDGTSCELPGSQPDGACHHHTTGCNESLTHNGLQKAAFHGMKAAFRLLGLHSDMDLGGLEIQPEQAAMIAANVGKGYLQATREEYDREESHEYYRDNIVDKVVEDAGALETIWSKLWGNEEERVEVLKEGIKKAWTQINKKEHHADGARTGIAAAEVFLDIEVSLDD